MGHNLTRNPYTVKPSSSDRSVRRRRDRPGHISRRSRHRSCRSVSPPGKVQVGLILDTPGVSRSIRFDPAEHTRVDDWTVADRRFTRYGQRSCDFFENRPPVNSASPSIDLPNKLPPLRLLVGLRTYSTVDAPATSGIFFISVPNTGLQVVSEPPISSRCRERCGGIPFACLRR